ncbi:MAG: hypothetical protein JSS91_13310 [Bacteroidetes bacterium]|nr:hypothetical protein [Bacteroidota bacterium]
MKIRKFIFSVLLLSIFSSAAYSVDPEFELKLTNRNYISSNLGYFDIVLVHKNYPQTELKYSSGKFTIILDYSYSDEHLNYIYSIDTATYGTERIPPQYIGNFSRIQDTLKIEQGIPVPFGSEPVISHTTGTLITRLRFFNPDLYLNSCIFGEQFSWKTNGNGIFTNIRAVLSGNIIQLSNSENIFSTDELCEDQFCCLSVPLTPPKRIFPLNNSLNNYWPVKLSWIKGFPVSYNAEIEIAADSLFSNIIVNDNIERPDGYDTVDYFTSELEFGTNYYWRVKQGGIPPQGAFNEPWKFRTGYPSLTLDLKVIPEGLKREINFYPYRLNVYLRNSKSPYQIVDSTVGYLKDTNFRAQLYFMNASEGNYYIVLDNNNYIETWSKAGGVFLSSSSSNFYDFSSGASQAYGSNQILISGSYCIFSGDLNNDGIIDISDAGMVDNGVFNFVKGESITDLNCDLITDIEDLSIVDKNVSRIVNEISP